MPKLRESLMRQRRGGPIETFTEEDERGNLSVWQEGGYDMDPVQAGIQDKPSVGAPTDPNAKPIFMTNIPQGGMGPSLDAPGGVPGSEQDRAQMDAQAEAAGSTVMDLSSKQKTPKPPAWVNPEVDLNAPGERDRFKQGFREDTFGGINLPDVDPIGEASRKWDPALYPKEFKQLADTLTSRVKAAREVEDRIMGEFDKNAAIQKAMRKHKTETATGQAVLEKEGMAKYIDLGKEYRTVLGDKQKLEKELLMAPDGTVKDSMNEEIRGLDGQLKEIEYQRMGLKNKYPGLIEPAKPEMKYTDENERRKMEGKSEGIKPQTPLQKKAAAFIADSIARGETKAQAFARFQAEQSAGKGAGKGPDKAAPAAKPAPAKIVKPAPTTPAKKSPGVSGSWGPPPPSTSQTAGSSTNIGGPPVTINTKDMVELADSIGINKENLDATLKAAAAAGGFTIDVLLTKPKNIIKRLLELAVSSQSETRRGMGL